MYDRFITDTLIEDRVEQYIFNGSYIYALTDEGLTVFDISEPGQPVEVSEYILFDTVFSGHIEGDFLYATSFGEFLIFNISNPHLPYLVGSLQLDSSPSTSIAIQGDYAYVSDGKRLIVVDIQSKIFPSIEQFNLLNGQVVKLIIEDGLLYAVFDDEGLGIYDLLFPAVPQLVGSTEFGFAFLEAQIVDDTLYIMSQSPSLITVDISDPQNPSKTGQFMDDIFLEDFQIIGDRFYGMENNFLHVLKLDQLDTVISTFIPRSGGFEVDVVDEIAYVHGSDFIESIDVAELVPTARYYRGNLFNNAGNVALNDQYLYVTATHDGFQVVDVSDPYSPELVYENLDLDKAEAVLVVGDYLYVIARSLFIFDLSDPSQPSEVGVLGTKPSERFFEMYLLNDDLLCAIQGNGMFIYDISDPLNPVVLGQVPHSGQVEDIQFDNDRLYISRFEFGIDVYDISNLSEPIFIVNYPFDNAVEKIQVRNNLVYAIDRIRSPRSTINIFDFSDLSSIRFVGGYEFTQYGTLQSFQLIGDRLYCSPFVVLDVSNPELIQPVGTYSSPGSILVQNELAYITTRRELTILNVGIGCGCEADFNQDDVLDFFDISSFLSGYLDGLESSDFNSDGVFDFFDVSSFLSAFAAGCP